MSQETAEKKQELKFYCGKYLKGDPECCLMKHLKAAKIDPKKGEAPRLVDGIRWMSAVPIAEGLTAQIITEVSVQCPYRRNTSDKTEEALRAVARQKWNESNAPHLKDISKPYGPFLLEIAS